MGSSIGLVLIDYRIIDATKYTCTVDIALLAVSSVFPISEQGY
jgi:hypothetical protein